MRAIGHREDAEENDDQQPEDHRTGKSRFDLKPLEALKIFLEFHDEKSGEEDADVRIDEGGRAREAEAVPVEEVVQVAVGVLVAELLVEVTHDKADDGCDEDVAHQNADAQTEQNRHDFVDGPQQKMRRFVGVNGNLDFNGHKRFAP